MFSPGIKPSVMLFTKANAVYSTIYVDHGVTDTVETSHTTNNYGHLKDSKPGIFSLNFSAKCEFPFTKRITLLVEPFIAVIRWQKLYSQTFINAGGNIGLTWKFENQSLK